MRSLQFSDVREAVEPRAGMARDVLEQWDARQSDGVSRGDGRARETPTLGVGRMDLAIGVLSLVLALMAWRRDRSKARREFLDGAVFLALGGLEQYLDIRQRSDR